MKAKYIRVRAVDNATEISSHVDTFDYERKFDDTEATYNAAVEMIERYGFCFSNFTYLNGQVYFFLTEDRKFMNNNAMKNYGWWKHRNRTEYNILIPTMKSYSNGSSNLTFNSDARCKITGYTDFSAADLSIGYFSDYAFLSGYDFTASNEYEFPFVEPELLEIGKYAFSASLRNGLHTDGDSYSIATGEGFDIQYKEKYGLLVLREENKLNLSEVFEELDMLFRIRYEDGTVSDTKISRDEWRVGYVYYAEVNVTKAVTSASIICKIKMTSNFSPTVRGANITFTSMYMVPMKHFSVESHEYVTSDTLGPVAIKCTKNEEFSEQVVPFWLRMESVPYFLKDEPEIMDTYAASEQGTFSLNKTGITITERTEEVSEFTYITEKTSPRTPHINETYSLDETFLKGKAVKREYDITINTTELMKNSTDPTNELPNYMMPLNSSAIGYNNTGVGTDDVISFFGLNENGKSYYEENNFTTLKTGKITDKVYTALSSPLFTCEINLFDVYNSTGRDYSAYWILNPHDFELTYQILVDGVDVTDSDVSIRMTGFNAKGEQVVYCDTQWAWIPQYQEGSDTNWEYGYNAFTIQNSFDYKHYTYYPEDVENYSSGSGGVVNNTILFTDMDSGNPKTTFIRYTTTRNFNAKTGSPLTTFVFTLEPHSDLYGKVIEVKNFSVVYMRRFYPMQITVQSKEKDSNDAYADYNVLELGTHVSLMDNGFKLISRGNTDMNAYGRRIETANDVGSWSSDWRCGLFAYDSYPSEEVTEEDYPNTSIVAVRSTILEEGDIVFFKQHGFTTDTYNGHANPFYSYDDAYGKLGALNLMQYDNMYISVVDLNTNEVLYTSHILSDGGFYKCDKNRTVNIEILMNNTNSSNVVHIDDSRLVLDLIKSSNNSKVKTLELSETCELSKIKVDYIKDTVGLTRIKKNFDVDVSLDGKKWIGVLKHRGGMYLPSLSSEYNEESFYVIRNLSDSGTSINEDSILGELSARYIRISPSNTSEMKYIGIRESEWLQDSSSEFFGLESDAYRKNDVHLENKFGILLSALSVIKDGEALPYSLSTLSKFNEEIEVYSGNTKVVSTDGLLEVSSILNSEKGSMNEDIYIKSAVDASNTNIGLVIDLGSIKTFDNVNVIQNFGGFSSIPYVAATDPDTFMYMMPYFLTYSINNPEKFTKIIESMNSTGRLYSDEHLTNPEYYRASSDSTGLYWKYKLLCESRIRCRIMSAFSIQISTDGENWTEIQDENLKDYVSKYGNDTIGI